jgi:CheY-like chemotaxis protein
VDDLLDVSRITRGKIRLLQEPVVLTAIVSRALEITQPLLKVRGHELTVNMPDSPPVVLGDPVRLAQVVGNLLNNAAKYTPDGGRIWLTVEGEGDEVLLRVRDTGIGIPQDMLASVFELFTQVECSLDRSHGGLGIGLTLVRQLVELHGGRVQAFSAGVNQGSEFVVRLPAHEGAPALPAVPQHEEARPSPSRCVLVVDDNQDAADSLAMLLRLGGHEVHVFHDGPTAVAAAAAVKPQVALLDIGLPEMNGFELARRLRMHPALTEILLVAVTGYGQDQDLRRSREAGFDHHLVKPVDPTALEAIFASCGRAV